jgi:parallel beta-helix repeat protein
MKRKWLAIGIILLFVGTCTIPSVTSEQTYDKNIITVDDEPGDADFTSIKEAVNSSSPGDTIEVYSGMYSEQEICIVKDNVTLLGISHELGGGNDSGKPLIQGKVTGRVLRVEASHVVVSNFRIEHLGTFASVCIWVSAQNNITISDCIIHGSKKDANDGIQVGKCNDTRIINNDISNCSCGILASSQRPGSLTITGNIITDCMPYCGIYLVSNQQNISGNRIRRCGENGIKIFGTNNTIYGNDIDSCPIGVCSSVLDFTENERGNTIIKNNFKNYSQDAWWNREVILYFFGLYRSKKDTWIGNYWDTWIGIGPKGILGWLAIGIAYDETGIGFIIPWFEYDRHPAKQPYDIPGFS